MVEPERKTEKKARPIERAATGGRPVTVGADSRINVRVPSAFAEKLRKKAKQWGVPYSELLRVVLANAYEEELFDPPAPGELFRDRIRRRGQRQGPGEDPTDARTR